jgi:hypothetical protein
MADLKLLYRSAGIFLGCFLLMISVAAYAAGQPPERPATLIIRPFSGKVAAPIIISGTQFLPGEEVEVVMTVGDLYHGLGTEKTDTIVADKAGTFEVSSGIPVRTPPGTYEIRATGDKGSVGVFNVQVVP